MKMQTKTPFSRERTNGNEDILDQPAGTGALLWLKPGTNAYKCQCPKPECPWIWDNGLAFRTEKGKLLALSCAIREGHLTEEQGRTAFEALLSEKLLTVPELEPEPEPIIDDALVNAPEHIRKKWAKKKAEKKDIPKRENLKIRVPLSFFKRRA